MGGILTPPSINPTVGDERAQFEAHFVSKLGTKPLTWREAEGGPYNVPDERQDNYYVRSTQQAWEAWQARAALAQQAPVAEPVAWQERQQTRNGWTDWYDVGMRKAMGKGAGLSEVLGGIEYQWRPLFAHPPAAEPARVYLVPTGETYEGRETYTRHDEPPPLSDYETLYANAPAAGSKALRELVDAAILWAYCPSAGGYRDGWAVEDTCEQLAAAVQSYTGFVNAADPYWSEEEMRAALAADKKGEAK